MTDKAGPLNEKEPRSRSMTTVEFLKPTGDQPLFSSSEEGIFPPTIFSDAVYTKGIRLFPETCHENQGRVSLQYGYNYTKTASLKTSKKMSYLYDETTVPLLSQQDALLWSHKHAAKSAAQNHFPMKVFRLLGVITRHVSSKNGPGLPRYTSDVSESAKAAKQPRMSIKAAMTEARGENPNHADLETRASAIQNEWNLKAQDGPRRKGWDQHGQLPLEAVNDPNYLPLPVLRDWIKRQNVVDSSPSPKSLYNGLRSIPVDLATVVDSLSELSCPEELYKIPLILPYVVVEACVPTSTRTGPLSKRRRVESSEQTWKIRIGVYANRLLPEVMTRHDLHIVMTALDPGSYRTLEPLHVPPIPKEPVFASSPSPLVVMDEGENISEDDEEEKKSDDIDETIGDSTRDESQISAFSIKGFLKLLENTGSDVSNWPSIEAKVAPFLKLKLMLHQQHGISWMLQMESLGGFGINSILWEERQFLDGGRYYYSPALGQIRLLPPPVMKGGILADEQGLGKTLEVVGLIVASLDELKREEADARKKADDDASPTHATLIIVPPALVSQWIAEIHKAVGDGLVVQYFDPSKGTLENVRNQGGAPDIVITTYAVLHKKNGARELSSFSWGRIVLDEMQEIRSSTTNIAKNCDKLVAQRRWMISGTPLFEGIGDLRGELNFLRLEPYAAALEDGFFDFSITNHWMCRSLHGLETLRILGMLILRRSKSMTIIKTKQPLLGLKPLTVEFVPVPQDPSERAIYCFLESVVSRVLKGDADDKSKLVSRSRCLRVLREMCISAVLLNGGLGVPSQLNTLHEWMRLENRREMDMKVRDTARTHGEHTFPFSCHASILCCDAAIRYLSQAHEDANVGDEFVSSLQMGMGGGATNRNRAAEDFATRLKDAEEVVSKATDALRNAKSKKARCLWHLALEKITTGHISFDHLEAVKPSYSVLWKFRHMAISLSRETFCRAPNVPEFLMRGWRPSTSFVATDLFENHPEFAWAHPMSYQLDGVPSSVTIEDIESSVVSILVQQNGHSVADYVGRLTVVRSPTRDSSLWKAVLQFSKGNDCSIFEKKASTANGIALACKEIAPQVQAMLDSTKQDLEEATAEYKVLPSTATQRKLAIARRNHDNAVLGLRIVIRSKEGPCYLKVTRAQGPCRSVQPHLYTGLCRDAAKCRSQCTLAIDKNTERLHGGNQTVADLRRTMSNQVTDDIQVLSVFETLCALASGEKHKTKCPICWCNLGVNLDSPDGDKSALVAMTNCGHLFCAECLKQHANSSEGRHTSCPSCRRAFDGRRPVLIIDPDKTSDQDALKDRRQRAKALVQRVSKILDESQGRLEGAIWEELYLSIDPPPGSDRSRHYKCYAIPKDIFAHLRVATSMQVHSQPNAMPNESFGSNAGISSKMRALLADLPRNERSVVFTESKSTVLHLTTVLEQAGIGCRALFTMQQIPEAQVALQEWKSSSRDRSGTDIIPFPVLIVQAGAAASGITLTDACKIFLLEPFSRQEEEQQAYARCHRYGQKLPVHCKCYYAPVSVESRLLEWRKRAVRERPVGAADESETRIVYSCLVDADDSDIQIDASNELDVEETDRTNFLLGWVGEDNRS